MRVMLIANTSASMVWFRLPLLRELVARGHRTWVLAPDGAGVDRIHETGANFLPLREVQGWATADDKDRPQSYVNPLVDLSTVRSIRRACRSVEPDLVLSYTHKLTVMGAMGARLARVPHIHGMITGFGLPNLDGGLRRRALREAFDASVRMAGMLSDSIIVLNADNRDDLLDRGLVAPSRLFLLDGEGVDVDRYQVHPCTWEKGRTTFLLVGRLVRFKGVGEFVAAARIVKARYPDTRFCIAGGADPNHPSAVPAEELDAWRSEGVVELLGHVSDVRRTVAEADVFCLPSYATEGLPMSTMEAMAMGRPILTTRTPGNRETVEDGGNGFLVDPEDPQGLAEAMLRLVEDPSLGPKMGARSRAIAEERFDARIVNGALLTHLGL